MLWNLQQLTISKIFILCFATLTLIGLQMNLSDSRIFSTDASALNSLHYKLEFTSLYAERSSLFELAFGHGVFSYKQAIEQLSVGGLNFGFDADIGYLLFHFGLIGMLILLGFFIAIKFKYDVPIYIYGLMLWAITSSVFFNIRNIAMFALVFIIFNLRRNLEKKYNDHTGI